MAPNQHDRPTCPGCGEPIGVYEPLWRVHPLLGAQPTSWMGLGPGAPSSSEALWHAACAEADGIEGG